MLFCSAYRLNIILCDVTQLHDHRIFLPDYFRECVCWLRPEKKALDHDFPKTNPIVLYFAVR